MFGCLCQSHLIRIRVLFPSHLISYHATEAIRIYKYYQGFGSGIIHCGRIIANTCVSGIITIDILDGKPQTPDGLVYSYLVKKIMQPFKVQANPPKPKAVGYGKDEKPATPIAKMTKGGIKLRERTAPLKYTVDDDLNLTDDDDDDVPFPTTRQVIEEWLPEVDSYIQTFLLDLFFKSTFFDICRLDFSQKRS